MTILSAKMSQMRTDCNDSAESDTEDVVLTSRKRARPANREIGRPRKIRKEKFLALQELQIGNDTTSCQTCHCEYENGMQGLQEYEENLRPEKVRAREGFKVSSIDCRRLCIYVKRYVKKWAFFDFLANDKFFRDI